MRISIDCENCGHTTEARDLYETAKILKVHPESLRRWARMGKIPSMKVERCTLFLVEDIVKFLTTSVSVIKEKTDASRV